MTEKFVSRRFIEAVHNILGEFDYQDTDNLDFALIRHNAFDLLNHTETPQDAAEVCEMFRFLLRYWDEVKKIFLNQRAMYKALEFDLLKMIRRGPKEEAYGVYFLSNAMALNPNDIFISSASFHDRAMRLGRDGDVYTMLEDGDYYMKFSPSSVLEMDVFSSLTDERICTVSADENFEFRLKNNRSEYYMMTDNEFGYTGFYEMSYIKRLRENEVINTDMLIGDIEWQAVDDDEYTAVTRFSLFDGYPEEREPLFLFAAAINLIYRRYMKTVNIDKKHDPSADDLPYRDIGAIKRYFK